MKHEDYADLFEDLSRIKSYLVGKELNARFAEDTKEFPCNKR